MPSKPITEKSQRVLHLLHAIDVGERTEFVSFSDPSFMGPLEDTTESSFCNFEMTRGDWEDFGEPDTITITIELGDKLNG
jgi:hypothetical protein